MMPKLNKIHIFPTRLILRHRWKYTAIKNPQSEIPLLHLTWIVEEAVGLDKVSYQWRYILLPSRLALFKLLYHVIGEYAKEFLMIAIEVYHESAGLDKLIQ